MTHIADITVQRKATTDIDIFARKSKIMKEAGKSQGCDLNWPFKSFYQMGPMKYWEIEIAGIPYEFPSTWPFLQIQANEFEIRVDL